MQIPKYVVGTFVNAYSAPNNNTKKQYWYLCDMDVEAGDYVVADCTPGMAVLLIDEVTTVNESDVNTQDLKWIVDRIDMSAFLARKERRNKLQLLERQLNDRLALIAETHKFKMLEADEQAAPLLAEYKQLKGV